VCASIIEKFKLADEAVKSLKKNETISKLKKRSVIGNVKTVIMKNGDTISYFITEKLNFQESEEICKVVYYDRQTN
jgi:hypothetical protein